MKVEGSCPEEERVCVATSTQIPKRSAGASLMNLPNTLERNIACKYRAGVGADLRRISGSSVLSTVGKERFLAT